VFGSDPDSTSTDYLADYLGRRFFGVSAVESMTLSDRADAEVRRAKKDDAQRFREGHDGDHGCNWPFERTFYC
jgi:hypothetical protein